MEKVLSEKLLPYTPSKYCRCSSWKDTIWCIDFCKGKDQQYRKDSYQEIMSKFCRATHSLHKFYLEKVPWLADIPQHTSFLTLKSIVSYYLGYSNHMSNTKIMMHNNSMVAHKRHIVTNLNLDKFQMDIYYNSFKWLMIQKGYL